MVHVSVIYVVHSAFIAPLRPDCVWLLFLFFFILVYVSEAMVLFFATSVSIFLFFFGLHSWEHTSVREYPPPNFYIVAWYRRTTVLLGWGPFYKSRCCNLELCIMLCLVKDDVSVCIRLFICVTGVTLFILFIYVAALFHAQNTLVGAHLGAGVFVSKVAHCSLFLHCFKAWRAGNEIRSLR